MRCTQFALRRTNDDTVREADDKPVMLNQMRPASQEFHLDRERSEKEKLRRERHFQVVELPMLRVIGFSLLTILVVARYALFPEALAADGAHPWLLGPISWTSGWVEWPASTRGSSRCGRISTSALSSSRLTSSFSPSPSTSPAAIAAGCSSSSSSEPPTRPTRTSGARSSSRIS